MWPLIRLVQRSRSPEQAARAVVHAATDPLLTGTTGVWIDQRGNVGEPSDTARDDQLAASVAARADALVAHATRHHGSDADPRRAPRTGHTLRDELSKETVTMTEVRNDRRRRTGGPPLVLVASVSAALAVAAVVIQNALTGGDAYPRPFTGTSTINDYFAVHGEVAQVAGTLQFAAAVPLAIFAATAYSQMRGLGVRVAGVTIALTGGVLASGFLAASGLLQWTLAGSTIMGDARAALHTLTFATGGTGHVVFLGLLVAGLAVPALIMRLLPRWLAVAGVVIAVAAEVSTLSLLFDPAQYLLPVGRFLGLAWIVAAGALLPTAPRTRNTRPTPARETS